MSLLQCDNFNEFKQSLTAAAHLCLLLRLTFCCQRLACTVGLLARMAMELQFFDG